MASGRVLRRPIEDPAVRASIWKTICLAADQLHSCDVFVRSSKNTQPQEVSAAVMPKQRTCYLVEALCLLGVLLKADSVQEKTITLFASIGPIAFTEDGEPRYLWAQKIAAGEITGLAGKPDLFVTTTPDLPTALNIDRIIEVKFVKHFGAASLRAEFGKGHDLRVFSHFIWTYYTPRADVVVGAKALRIDLQPIGFDTDRHQTLIEDPTSLLSQVANALEESRKAQRFAAGVEQASKEVRQKLLGPAKPDH